MNRIIIHKSSSLRWVVEVTFAYEEREPAKPPALHGAETIFGRALPPGRTANYRPAQPELGWWNLNCQLGVIWKRSCNFVNFSILHAPSLVKYGTCAPDAHLNISADDITVFRNHIRQKFLIKILPVN